MNNSLVYQFILVVLIMDQIRQSQSIVIAFYNAGFLQKMGGLSQLRNEMPTILEKMNSGTSLEDIVNKKKLDYNIEPVIRKMPCGALENSEGHYPVLTCDFCDHKLTEASVSGFC